MTRKSSAALKDALGAEDWEKAALSALAEGGMSAVSVEAIARTLGVTKGSFYWHFKDRDALLRAALARWETRYTDRVIAALEEIADPREKLRRLLTGVNVSEKAWRVHVALHEAKNELAVSGAMKRVSARRIEYLASCYRAIGCGKSEARSRAVLAYSAYLGLLHLRLEAPEQIPEGRALDAYLDVTMEALIPRG